MPVRRSEIGESPGQGIAAAQGGNLGLIVAIPGGRRGRDVEDLQIAPEAQNAQGFTDRGAQVRTSPVRIGVSSLCEARALVDDDQCFYGK
eukprot:TRINITY_DN95643_c0_g1_i1.p1 TRINITY_DN95643_c0_g1~~TRINITY_DN95643_c0_g1_i1.p1  ORF type:complete len:103 (+),score=10.43 TRINITY_DN95643_c0_g1_i1:42-311(+)